MSFPWVCLGWSECGAQSEIKEKQFRENQYSGRGCKSEKYIADDDKSFFRGENKNP